MHFFERMDFGDFRSFRGIKTQIGRMEVCANCCALRRQFPTLTINATCMICANSGSAKDIANELNDFFDKKYRIIFDDNEQSPNIITGKGRRTGIPSPTNRLNRNSTEGKQQKIKSAHGCAR